MESTRATIVRLKETLTDGSVCQSSDAGPVGTRSGITVTVRGMSVALFNVNGTVCAIADTCLHAGVS